MSIVDFDSATWTDPWFEELQPNQKLLFIYLWSNSHKNVACLYSITEKKISDDTGLPVKHIKPILDGLFPKVKYDEVNRIIWVVNHVKRQFLRNGNMSPKIVVAIQKCVRQFSSHHPFVNEFKLLYSMAFEDELDDIFLKKREIVWVRDGGTCQYCGEIITIQSGFEMDHIKAKANGGGDSWDNLATSCRFCNQAKSNLDPEVIGMVLPNVGGYSRKEAIRELLNNPPLLANFICNLHKETAFHIGYPDRVSGYPPGGGGGVGGGKGGGLKKGEPDELFDEFWSLYPKKVNKGQARKAWDKIEQKLTVMVKIREALEWQYKSDKWVKDKGQFIPNPATYLNGEGWEDEPPKDKGEVPF